MSKLSLCKVGLIVLGTAGIAGFARGQEATNSVMEASSPSADSDYPLYHAQELSIDGFASGTLHERYFDHFNGHTLRHDARFGAGLGANYFFTRYLGIGGDAYSESVTRGEFVDAASGNLIVRVPIINTGIAPYVFGGGGHQFDLVQQTFGQAGAGLEFRVVRHVGLFVDARAVFPDRTQNYGEARAGLRISF